MELRSAICTLVILFATVLYKIRHYQHNKYSKYFYEYYNLSEYHRSDYYKLRILIGFESVKYNIYKTLNTYDKKNVNNSLCFKIVQDMSDFHCAIFKVIKHDLNNYYYVNDTDVLKTMLSEYNQYFKERLGGTGIYFIRHLKRMYPDIKAIFLGELSEYELSLLPNNVTSLSIRSSIKNRSLNSLGGIFVSSGGRRAIFDRASVKLSINNLHWFKSSRVINEHKPHCIVISQFSPIMSPLKEEDINELESFSQNLAAIPSRIITHYQYGHIKHDEDAKLILKFIIPYIDSLDTDLRGLHQLVYLTNPNIDVTDLKVDIDTTLRNLKILVQSHSMSTMYGGMRSLGRVHIRAHDYHVLLVTKDSAGNKFYPNNKYALAKALIARLKSRCGFKPSQLTKMAKNVVFHLEDEFFHQDESNLTSLIKCMGDQNSEYHVCIAAVPSCNDLTFPIDEAQQTSIAALIPQIKIHDDL